MANLHGLRCEARIHYRPTLASILSEPLPWARPGVSVLEGSATSAALPIVTRPLEYLPAARSDQRSASLRPGRSPFLSRPCISAWRQIGVRDQARFFAVGGRLGADQSRWNACGWLRMPQRWARRTLLPPSTSVQSSTSRSASGGPRAELSSHSPQWRRIFSTCPAVAWAKAGQVFIADPHFRTAKRIRFVNLLAQPGPALPGFPGCGRANRSCGSCRRRLALGLLPPGLVRIPPVVPH